jgi:hypothetical protein
MTTEINTACSAGVSLVDAARVTGLTVWQLRRLAYRGGIRHRRVGHRVMLHPADVDTLARNMWAGEPVSPERAAAVISQGVRAVAGEQIPGPVGPEAGAKPSRKALAGFASFREMAIATGGGCTQNNNTGVK